MEDDIDDIVFEELIKTYESKDLTSLNKLLQIGMDESVDKKTRVLILLRVIDRNRISNVCADIDSELTEEIYSIYMSAILCIINQLIEENPDEFDKQHVEWLNIWNELTH